MPHSELDFLLSHLPPGEDWQYQCAYGTRDKRALAWVPGGRRGDDAYRYRDPDVNAPLFGLAQGIYPEPATRRHQYAEPEIWLGWTGIDIDLGEGRSPAVVADGLKKLIPFSSFRTSCSGKGLHVITRITHIKVPTERRTHYVKAINRPIVDLILNSGLVMKEELCKFDYRIFWLFGGKNSWLHKSKDLLSCTLEGVARRITDTGGWGRSPVTSGETAVEGNQHLTGILDRLRSEGLELKSGRTQTNICYAYRALVNTPYAFSTRSGEPTGDDPRSRINGFIEYIPGRRITIFSNADGRVVREFCTPEEMRSRIGG